MSPSAERDLAPLIDELLRHAEPETLPGGEAPPAPAPSDESAGPDGFWRAVGEGKVALVSRLERRLEGPGPAGAGPEGATPEAAPPSALPRGHTAGPAEGGSEVDWQRAWPALLAVVGLWPGGDGRRVAARPPRVPRPAAPAG
jgi:hypothetical protein